MSNLIVWDIETIPDLQGFAAANGHLGKSDDEVRAELGDKFPKHVYHLIICIGALVAHREEVGRWTVDALGAPHVGERSEKDLITSFVEKIAALSPQLVTFNGSSFDLPVLRYRAMVHGVAAPGLAARPYFHRYTEDAVDLCDVLSSFSSQAKATLHELCRVMGLPGKPEGMTGAEVSRWAYSADCRILRERRAQHVPGVAPARTVPRAIVRCRVSGERGRPCRVREGAEQYEAAPYLPNVTVACGLKYHQQTGTCRRHALLAW